MPFPQMDERSFSHPPLATDGVTFRKAEDRYHPKKPPGEKKPFLPATDATQSNFPDTKDGQYISYEKRKTATRDNEEEKRQKGANRKIASATKQFFVFFLVVRTWEMERE